jgi:LysR family glycine cleavage system transcriptional activator
MRTKRDLPPLDTLRGFDAAARHLSFTRAADELHLTQSAMSRQVKALEDALGVALFERRHRALALTAAGRSYHRTVADVLGALRAATASLRPASADRALTVTTTISFASLWLVPRLGEFHRAHPDVDVHVAAKNTLIDLERADIDLAIRYCPRERAGAGAVRLFGERILPVASPRLVKRALKQPADIARYPLLHYEDPEYAFPWMSWQTWFEAMGVAMPAGVRGLRLSNYEQIVQAAMEGEGIALGRLPLVERWIRDKRLIAPLARLYATSTSTRAFWILAADRARQRPDAAAFIAWIRKQAARA